MNKRCKDTKGQSSKATKPRKNFLAPLHLCTFEASSGFTIIELVVVTGVLVAIGGMIAGILASTLRGTNKTRITTAVTQNGNQALSVITDTIHDSDAVVTSADDNAASACSVAPAVATPQQSIILHRIGGGYTTFDCANNIIHETTSPAGSSSVNPSPIVQSLIDASQVKTTSCSFTCTQADLYTPPTISIQYGLVSFDTSSFSEKQASTSFTTQVSMYNSAAR